MSKQPNTGAIVNTYGFRLNEQQLAEEQFDPTTGACKSVRASNELQLVAPSSSLLAGGNTQGTAVSTGSFVNGILVLNVTAVPSGSVQFTVQAYSSILNVWFTIPSVTITNITVPGIYPVTVNYLGQKIALSWNNACTAGAVLIAGS